MDEVERVALWIGLLGSVVSTSLAVVALAFTYVVNKRSDNVSDQTIRSLERIQGSVQRVSDDTTNLIKAGWDKMLAGLAVPSPQDAELEPAQEVAAGLRAEISETLRPTDGAQMDMKDLVDELANNAEDAVKAGALEASDSARAVDRVLSLLDQVSPAARELAKVLAFGPRHLKRTEYQLLMHDPRTSQAVREMRSLGFLTPRVHRYGDGHELVYYFPSRLNRAVRAAFMLRTHEPEQPDILEALAAAGYGPNVDNDGGETSR